MMHPEAVPNETDDHRIEAAASADVALTIDKSMALVFWDRQPVEFVGCWMSLWATISGLYREALDECEPHTVSIAWLPFGHLGPDAVDSLHMPASIWFACCEDEDRMCAYFEIIGIIEPDADEEPAPVGHA